MSRDSSVGIVTGFFSWQVPVFSLLHNDQTGPAPPPPAFFPIDSWVLSSGVKQEEHEANYSTPSSAVVKNHGALPRLHHTSS
jgi:hypothetical protein